MLRYIFGFIIGCLTVFVLHRPPDLAPQLRAVEEKCAQLAETRCMNVTTPVLNVTVYDTPNIGRAKVKP
jgi:hypothetical protein